MHRVGANGQESRAGKGTTYSIYDALGIGDDAVVDFLQVAARLVVDERPTVEQVSALAASLREAVIAAEPTEATIASLGLFPRLEALARNNPTLFSVSERLLIGVLLELIAWGLRASLAAKSQSTSPVVVHVEPSDDELREIVQEQVRKTQQQRP